jgi:hypothetical protein
LGTVVCPLDEIVLSSSKETKDTWTIARSREEVVLIYLEHSIVRNFPYRVN